MTFRVFFCAGVCGLLPQADASGLMPPLCPVPAISSEQVCLGSLTVKLKSQNAVQHAGDQEGQPGGAEHVLDIVEDTGFCQLAD